MSKRSAAETVSRIFRAFVDNRSGSQAELARKVGVSVRALRTRPVELATGGRPLERDEASPLVFWSVPRGWIPDGVAVATPEVAQLLRFIARSPRTPTRDALMRKLLPADAVAAITPNAADLPERESTLATLEDAQARRRAGGGRTGRGWSEGLQTFSRC